MTIDLFADAPESTMNPKSMSTADLLEKITEMNAAYRAGSPTVSDGEYDHVWLAELRRRDPQHPFLAEPEPADVSVPGARVALPAQMLSTDKAYDAKEVAAWVQRVANTAISIGMDPNKIVVQVRAKLDGIAAYDTGSLVCTRGRNGYGTDITHWFDRSAPIVTSGGRGRGAGEIVVAKEYFDTVLAAGWDLDHPRNYTAGLVGAETTRDYHERALNDSAVILVSYEDLPTQLIPLAEIAERWESALDEAMRQTPYLCDGAVAQIAEPALRKALGSTSHHHRWQLALKRNDEFAESHVTAIRMTCGRTGRITPTLEIKPVSLYGVTITWVTAHTAQHIIDLGLGAGAKVCISRGGGVIPRLENVTERAAEHGVDLDHCPSCGHQTEWDGPYLTCPNVGGCSAQTARAIAHFFKTLSVANGFGESVTTTLATAGVSRPVDIYGMSVDDFVRCGISAGIAANLVKECDRSRTEPIEDAILLGAMGHRNLGRGDSRKLLAHHPIETLGEITAEKIAAIPGFGALTSGPIAESLLARWDELRALLDLGFNLKVTPRVGESSVESPIAGKTIVFTGAMQSGSRDDMEAKARQLGAIVGSSVSKKTSYLVCGANVGATKTGKAADLGVSVLSEADYLALIESA